MTLASGETIQTMVGLDLDEERHFSQGFLVLTNQRLLALSRDGKSQSWQLGPALSLDASVMGGLGKLKLAKEDAIVGQWWFTAARNSQIDRFVGQFIPL